MYVVTTISREPLVKLKKLSKSDFDILASMYTLVDGIAAMYGNDTEVLIHSLDVDNPSIIKIANGHITGRSVGAPITNLAMQKLRANNDISEPYFTKNEANKTLRSQTSIIRNTKGDAIGLFCINMDMDAPLQSVLKNLLLTSNIQQNIVYSSEIFAKSTDEAVMESIDNVSNDILKDESITPAKKNRAIVSKLFEMGIFELKDSTQIVSDRLVVSTHSIYRYLRELKK